MSGVPFSITLTAALVAAGVASAACPPFRSGGLPQTVGGLLVDVVPAPGSTIGVPPVIRFNGKSVVVKQRPTTLGLEISFQTGSVGPVDAQLRDSRGRVLQTQTFLTTSTPPGVVTYYAYTQGAYDVLFKSRNNEGAVVSVCETRRVRPPKR